MTSLTIVKYISRVRWLLPVLALTLPALSPGVAISHDHNTAKSPEEARVFDFYATWYRPSERTYSCCSMQDCHVVEIKREGSKYYFLDRISYAWPTWREIPPDRLEHNARDPRESPDGQSHACFNSMYVLCVVLGSGQ